MMGVLGACIDSIVQQALRGSLHGPRVAVAFALVALIVPVAAQQRDRASIPEKYKWDLTQIYPSNAAWRAAKEKLEADIPGIRQFKGTLGASPAALADALERVTTLRKTLYRVATYANLQADQDTRHAEHQGMRQEMTLLGASFGTEVAFIEPEILQIGRDEASAVSARPSRGWPRTVSISTKFSAARRTR